MCFVYSHSFMRYLQSMFHFASDSNFYIKTAMHWFHFPQIQELPPSTVTSFIGQFYSFSVHLVLLILLMIALFTCLNKELPLWWIFSYLFSLIGELENEFSVSLFAENVIVNSTMRLTFVFSG